MSEAVLFGGGCFWCIEPALSALRGVTYVYVGYSGGVTHYPTYEQVSNQNTGHIEVVKVRYNADAISFKTLLEAFFSLHDPTTLNQQGTDVGSQYASAIFYTTSEQLQEAKAYIERLENQLKKPVVTRLIPAEVFWPAEIEHVNYYLNDPLGAYSLAVIQPKLREFSKRYNSIIKTKDDIEY